MSAPSEEQTMQEQNTTFATHQKVSTHPNESFHYGCIICFRWKHIQDKVCSDCNTQMRHRKTTLQEEITLIQIMKLFQITDAYDAISRFNSTIERKKPYKMSSAEYK